MSSPPPSVSSTWSDAAVHVDQQPGRLDAEAHQVDEVRAAAEEPRAGLVRQQRDRAGGVVGTLVPEGPHAPASRIAGTRLT